METRLLPLPSCIFGVTNGTPYAGYYRAFRMVFSRVSSRERALAQGLELTLEIVRLRVNRQFPELMLYPRELATRPQPFNSIGNMCLALGSLASNKTPAINGAKLILLPAMSGGRVSAPSGPTSAALGRGQGRGTSQTSA